MKRSFWFAIVFLVVLFLASFWITIDIWNECREGHSFFYCLKLVTR